MSSQKISSATTPKHSRHTRDYGDHDLTGPNFVDHFSLREPSSTVKFRGARVHVYETFNEQILLEDRQSSRGHYGNPIHNDFYDSDDSDDDDDDNNGKNRPRLPPRHNITVKRMPWSSFGLTVLRLAYTLVSLLIFGYAFALSFQIILFLFVKLAADSGFTSGGRLSSFSTASVSTLLSTPIFLFGFSSLMAIATTFVAEAWSGGHLIRAVIGAPTVLKEILYFVFFILIPALTFVGALFTRLENPWETACYAWLGSVAFIFFCFGLAIVWCEVAACFRLISIHYDADLEGTTAGHSSSPSLSSSSFQKLLLQVRRAILLVQTQKYSGQKHEQYLITGDDVAPTGGYTFSDEHEPTSVKQSLFASTTQLSCLRFMYEVVDPPKRIYSIEEVRDVQPFVTSHSWSLENLYCTSDRNRKIITAKGPAALKRSQILTSSACNVLGSFLIIIGLVSSLVWMKTGPVSYILVGMTSIFCFLLPLINSNMKVLQMYTDIRDKNEKLSGENTPGDDDDGVEAQPTKKETVKEKTTMFRLWETSRVTKPKIWVCYTGMLLEFLFLFLLPIATLFSIGNNPIGYVFFVMSFFSFLRKYFNAATILCELGSMNSIDIEREPGKERPARSFLRRETTFRGEDKTLVMKSRLADIVGNISRSDTVIRWLWFFGTLVLLTFFLYSAAIASDDGLGERPPIILVDDYAYVLEKGMPYPTCSLGRGFEFYAGNVSLRGALEDYAFLSAMAYETTNVTDYLLPQWFGEGVAVDESDLVQQYRKNAGNQDTPVFFKFFSFPDVPDFGVLSIRGSQTSWDWMVNMQLWSASALAQFVKWLTPYGWIWTPVLDDLVWFISFIQADQLDDVSYYKVTTAFVEKFKKTYESMHVTGASLGGGLAVITGAQARAPAVAISGLGAELSRNTLKPIISKDDIDKYVFNFIPDRDYIARIGGRPRQHQEAQCNAATSDLFGCHSMWRSVCEINYRCGSNGRPVICRCHFVFGYPEPEPIGNQTRSFKEACIEQEQAFRDGTGSTIKSGWW